MNIIKLFQRLNEGEKEELLHLLSQEKIMMLRISSKENKNKTRLYYLLQKHFPIKNIFDITQKEFLLIRGAGKKMWLELQELRGF